MNHITKTWQSKGFLLTISTIFLLMFMISSPAYASSIETDDFTNIISKVLSIIQYIGFAIIILGAAWFGIVGYFSADRQGGSPDHKANIARLIAAIVICFGVVPGLKIALEAVNPVWHSTGRASGVASLFK